MLNTALLALSLSVWPPPLSVGPPGEDRPLGACVTRHGALVSVFSRDDEILELRIRRDRRETNALTVPMAELAPGARVIQARIVPWYLDEDADAYMLALALATDTGHSYRFLHNGPDATGGKWTLSPPIFESRGTPFRIAELRLLERNADAIEITFRRGNVGIDGDMRGVEERVYVDPCTPAGVSGSALIDTRTGKVLARHGKSI